MNILFVIKVKIIVLIRWSYSLPPLGGALPLIFLHTRAFGNLFIGGYYLH